MLPNETEEVRECLRRAEECARQAKAQFDTKFRQAFLDLELVAVGTQLRA